MIVLDGNIGRDEWQKLVAMRIRPPHIGHDVGIKGLSDEQQIIPWLHRRRGSTFFTHDLGFFQQRFCHARRCLVVLDVPRQEAADSIKRFLRHPVICEKSKRMGYAIHLMHTGLTAYRLNEEQIFFPWKVRGRSS